MNIDLEMLAKLRQLDERQLAEAILTLAEAAGADEKQKKRLLENVGYIRRRIQTATDKELLRTAEKLTGGSEFDQGKVDELLKKFRGL
ncbi:MAG: hypothetical protein ACOYID_03955 [Eubacteriales bacterium]|jgi:hypothetical protein|nr:hypothetical protein [Clostridiales bacterium]